MAILGFSLVPLVLCSAGADPLLLNPLAPDSTCSSKLYLFLLVAANAGSTRFPPSAATAATLKPRIAAPAHSVPQYPTHLCVHSVGAVRHQLRGESATSQIYLPRNPVCVAWRPGCIDFRFVDVSTSHGHSL
ncbi:hypothetical protein DFH06DRAFT_1204787 [Mycena polygramma]|nr:hypothetical protein DFH06DRAFT_1204787 [Mycena polygramma]